MEMNLLIIYQTIISKGLKPISVMRGIFPKDKDITKLTQKKLQKIKNLLNNMTRKILGYKTPKQVWNEKISQNFRKNKKDQVVFLSNLHSLIFS
jgi:hypothetical protein